MSRSVKLAPTKRTRPSAMEDMRCWAERATEMILELRDDLKYRVKLDNRPSDKIMLERTEHFLLTGELPTNPEN